MFIICVLITLFHQILTASDSKQCSTGYFLKTPFFCDDCTLFCTSLYSLTADQIQICLPYCSKKTTFKIINVTSTPEISRTDKIVSTTSSAAGNINYALVGLIAIPVIAIIIIIVVLLWCRKKIAACCRKPKPEPKVAFENVFIIQDNTDPLCEVLINQDNTAPTYESVITDTEKEILRYNKYGPQSIASGSNAPCPLDDEIRDMTSPQLDSMAPMSMPYEPSSSINQNQAATPIMASLDPKPIPRDFAISRNPELVQSIMAKNNEYEAPSELIQVPKKEKNLYFDLSKNTKHTIPLPSHDDQNYPSDDSQRAGDDEPDTSTLETTPLNMNAGQSNFYNKGPQFDSLYTPDNADSLQPEDSPLSSPKTPEYGHGNSRTIFAVRDPPPVIESNQDEDDDEIENPFSSMPLPDPDSPVKTKSFFE